MRMRAAVPVLLGGVILGLMYHLKRRTRRHMLPVPLAFNSCHIGRFSGYKLYVSLPLSYDSKPNERFPVLVVLDAEPYLFPLLTICARTNHFFARSYWYPDVIVVGIVADLEADESLFVKGKLDVKRFWDEMRPTRARDYLPTAAESPWGTWPGAVSLLEHSGHADEFATFLANRLLPHIDGAYRTMGDGARALIGKSFSGCGVACCMIHPECARRFSEFLMCSPSLSWDDFAWFRIESSRRASHEAGLPNLNDARAEASAPHDAAVFCCVGGEEDTTASRRLKDTLDSRNGTNVVPVRLDVLEGETHGSASFPFVHRAMDFLKERWRPRPAM